MKIQIDTTYADLMAAMTPAGMFPDAMLELVGDQLMDCVPLDQAQFMIEQIKSYDARFGAGSYITMSGALTSAIQRAMAALPPMEMLAISVRMMEMQGLSPSQP